MNLVHMLHVLMVMWHHHHDVPFRLALRYLRREYPGMPRGWYNGYLQWLHHFHIPPKDW